MKTNKAISILYVFAIIGSFILGLQFSPHHKMMNENTWLKEANAYKLECLQELDACLLISKTVLLDPNANTIEARIDSLAAKNYYKHLDKLDSLYIQDL